MAWRSIRGVGNALDGNPFRNIPSSLTNLDAFRTANTISINRFGKSLSNIDGIEFKQALDVDVNFSRAVDDILMDPNLVTLIVKNVDGAKQKRAVLNLIEQKNIESYIRDPNAPRSLGNNAEIGPLDVVNVVRRELEIAGGDAVRAWPKIKEKLGGKWAWLKGGIAISAIVFVFVALADWLKNSGKTFPITKIVQKDTGGGSLLSGLGTEKGIVIHYDGDGFEMEVGRKVSAVETNCLPSADNTYEIETSAPDQVGVTCCALEEEGTARGYVKYSFSFGDSLLGNLTNLSESVGDAAGKTINAAAEPLLKGLFGNLSWVVIAAIAILFLFLFMRK